MLSDSIPREKKSRHSFFSFFPYSFLYILWGYSKYYLDDDDDDDFKRQRRACILLFSPSHFAYHRIYIYVYI